MKDNRPLWAGDESLVHDEDDAEARNFIIQQENAWDDQMETSLTPYPSINPASSGSPAEFLSGTNTEGLQLSPQPGHFIETAGVQQGLDDGSLQRQLDKVRQNRKRKTRHDDVTPKKTVAFASETRDETMAFPNIVGRFSALAKDKIISRLSRRKASTDPAPMVSSVVECPPQTVPSALKKQTSTEGVSDLSVTAKPSLRPKSPIKCTSSKYDCQ